MYKRLTGFLFLLTFCTPFIAVAQDGPISYTAKDSITSDVDAGTVELFNEVHFTFGETKWDAGYAKIFWEEGIVIARGIENKSGDIDAYVAHDRIFHEMKTRSEKLERKADIRGG